MPDTPTEALRLADAIDPLKRKSLDNLTCAAAAQTLRALAALAQQQEWRPIPAIRDSIERLRHVDSEIWEDITSALDAAKEGHHDANLDELDCTLLLDLIWLYRNVEPVLTGKPPIAESADAARDVLAERRRQIEVEGWTPEHDDEHHQARSEERTRGLAPAAPEPPDTVECLQCERLLWRWNGSTGPAAPAAPQVEPVAAERALRAIVAHWDEFGPEHGLDEIIDRGRRTLAAAATTAQPAPEVAPSVWRDHTPGLKRNDAAPPTRAQGGPEETR